MKKTIIAAALLAASTGALAADCNKDGKFHWSTCFGLQHSIITAVVQGAMGEASGGDLYAPVGIGACAVFIGLELRGKGGLFDSPDRTLDWIAPCATAYGLYKWRGTPVSELLDKAFNLDEDEHLAPIAVPGYTGVQYDWRFH